jgi:hypothetical protein
MRVASLTALLAVSLASCSEPAEPPKQQAATPVSVTAPAKPAPPQRAVPRPAPAIDWLARAKDTSLPMGERISAAAMERLRHSVRYDPEYLRIPYPMGDVPASQGVCTDEIVRAYRTIGIDLQKLVHEDMKANFAAYPRRWGLARPDTNIDHRRVPNLQVYFTRKGQKLPVTQKGEDYRAGDIVTWMLPGNLPHIGIATAQRSADGKRPLIVHNIGRGPQLEDMLFSYPITGRYVYPGR